jgi:hypothetical protein
LSLLITTAWFVFSSLGRIESTNSRRPTWFASKCQRRPQQKFNETSTTVDSFLFLLQGQAVQHKMQTNLSSPYIIFLKCREPFLY